MKKVTIGLLLLAAVSLLGIQVKAGRRQSQAEMTQQAAKDFQKADKELNQVYAKLSKAIEPSKRKRLVEAQRAWIKFRDASLEARFACEDQDDRVCWGSMIQLDWPAYKTMLTRERTEQLNKLLAERYSAE